MGSARTPAAPPTAANRTPATARPANSQRRRRRCHTVPRPGAKYGLPSRKYCAGGIRLRYCRAAIFASVFGQCSRRIPGFPMPPALVQDSIDRHYLIGATAYSGQRCRPAGRWRASGRIGAGWGQSRGWSGSESSDFCVGGGVGRVRASRGALRAAEPAPTFGIPRSGGKWTGAGSRRRFLSGGWAGRP